MNYAKNKTTLNINKIIAMSAIINLFMSSWLIGQNKEILSNVTETDKSVHILNTKTEDISAGDGTDIKSKYNKTDSIIKKLEEMEIPDYDTSFKTYMDYRCITDKTSAQYELQQSALTDVQGFRRYGDCYLVAMGTYYSDSVGDTFKITLDNGSMFSVMIGDIKSDIHTDDKNMFSPVYDEKDNFVSANVLEFIVDTQVINEKIIRLGTVEGYEEFAGNITKIERSETIDLRC